MTDSTPPSTWPDDELTRVGEADELRVSSRRDDGTLRPAVTIWHARVGDELYIRSAQGPERGWFRRAEQAGAGHISSGGVEPGPADERGIGAEVGGRLRGDHDEHLDVVAAREEQVAAATRLSDDRRLMVQPGALSTGVSEGGTAVTRNARHCRPRPERDYLVGCPTHEAPPWRTRSPS